MADFLILREGVLFFFSSMEIFDPFPSYLELLRSFAATLEEETVIAFK